MSISIPLSLGVSEDSGYGVLTRVPIIQGSKTVGPWLQGYSVRSVERKGQRTSGLGVFYPPTVLITMKTRSGYAPWTYHHPLSERERIDVGLTRYRGGRTLTYR